MFLSWYSLFACNSWSILGTNQIQPANSYSRQLLPISFSTWLNKITINVFLLQTHVCHNVTCMHLSRATNTCTHFILATPPRTKQKKDKRFNHSWNAIANEINIHGWFFNWIFKSIWIVTTDIYYDIARNGFKHVMPQNTARYARTFTYIAHKTQKTFNVWQQCDGASNPKSCTDNVDSN